MTRPGLTLPLLLASSLLLACDPRGSSEAQGEAGEPRAEGAGEASPKAEGPTGAEPADPDAEPDAAPESEDSAAPSPRTLMADPSASKVGFAVARATSGHVAHFAHFDARLELDGELPRTLEIAVKTLSVVADRQGLTQHLKSADFFDVAQFPTSSFISKQISAKPEQGPQAYEITGTMRLHGVERELKFPASFEIDAQRVRGVAELVISAKDFGIEYEGMEAELAEDAVSLEIELVFPRVAGPPPSAGPAPHVDRPLPVQIPPT